ncbi:MAG: hypothetical protein KDA53_16280 [Hyphomonas sp.]|nr:hypothetical protein [Hyphomonas sp.]
MRRKIAGGIAGVFIAIGVLVVARILGHIVFPGYSDGSVGLHQQPFTYQAVEVAAWFLGALCGIFASLWLTGGSRRAAVIVAGVMLGVVTLILFNQASPAWMVATGLSLPVIAGFLATRIIPFEHGNN